MQRVLITAGPIYGPLDTNKLVGNRVRGIWATKFARVAAKCRHEVTLLVPDTMAGTTLEVLSGLPEWAKLNVVQHRGYQDYAEKCYAMALTHDAAVMAGAVVNWIPAKPFLGKMPTEGYAEGDIIQVPFVLAPRVINRMRVLNPKLTLIGCKMLVGSTSEELVDAAYHVLLTARCNVVVANDMGHGLRRKRLVYPDRTVVDYDNDFNGFFDALLAVIEDEHWHSEELEDYDQGRLHSDVARESRDTFDAVVEKYRSRFTPRGDGKVFGSLLVYGLGGFLISPREKSQMFSAADAVLVQNIVLEDRKVLLAKRTSFEAPSPRATMNAPLLVRIWQKYRPRAVLHLHEQLPGVPTLPYAPPGTDRDNLRTLPGPAFNIEGHGFVACLKNDLEIPL